jgi:zinc protease
MKPTNAATINATLTAEYLKSLPGPHDITRSELSNGIVVLTRPNFNNASVVINGNLNCGSIFDLDDKLGLARFTALSLMRGTQDRSFQEIYDALESVGASLGFDSSVHHTSFGGRALAEDLPLVLSLLAECLRKPVFPQEHVERLRAQVLTALAMRDQDTFEVASLAFDDIVFAQHPYGRPGEGHPQTVQTIMRDDIVDFHRRFYGPKGMVIAVVGAVAPREAIDMVEDTLGDWINPRQEEQPQIPQLQVMEGVMRKHITIEGKVQTDLVMGVPGPKRKSPDYFPASLGNNILGQIGLMGRIGDVVREQAGLAYTARTSFSAWQEAGSWEVTAGVNPVNLQRAIDLIISELQRFAREPVTAEELSDSQSNFIGRLPLSLESNSGVTHALLNLERYQLGLDYYQRYPQLVSDVTAKQVLEVAQRYLDTNRLCIVSAGPPADDKGGE